MALNGPRSESTSASHPVSGTLRPDSPFVAEEAGHTDVEDLEEVEAINMLHIQYPSTSATATNVSILSVPITNYFDGDNGSVTDIEVVSENDENDSCSETEIKDPESSKEIENILRDYENNGEVCVRDAFGDQVTVFTNTLSALIYEAAATTSKEDVLTDVSELEEEDDINVDIIGTEAPEFIQLIPGESSGMEEVTIVEKDLMTEQDPSKKYTLAEFFHEEDCLTELESLGSNSSRKHSVDNDQKQIPGPMLGGTTLVNLTGLRSITPSDCGDDRLYENMTDEELEDPVVTNNPAVQMQNLQVDAEDQGASTDCEDIHDSGDDDSFKDEWSITNANSAHMDAVLEANVAVAQANICLSENGASPHPESPVDNDAEIRCKLIDSRHHPCLTISTLKNQLFIESDEDDRGAITDTEDVSGDDTSELESSSFWLAPNETQAKILRDMMDGTHSSVLVQESENLEGDNWNSLSPCNSQSVKVDGDRAKNVNSTPTNIPAIIVPDGCGNGSAPSGGGKILRRRGKKKHAK